MDDLIKSLDNLCAAIEHLAEATTESKQEQAPTAAAIKKGVSGQLLEIMARAANAANDSSDDRKLGQWVFEGCDAKWQSAAVDAGGRAYRHNFPADLLHAENSLMRWESDCFGHEVEPLSGRFDATDWQNSVIQRQPINDIDYLTDNDCDHDIAPDTATNISFGLGITQADRQLIFIKNLSDVLVQRMHSQDRFSEEDYVIGGNDLKAWDIVVDCDGLFGFALCDLVHHESNLLNRVRILRLKKFQDTTFTHAAIINGWRMDDINWHTITKAQLPAFRAALEACYAN